MFWHERGWIWSQRCAPNFMYASHWSHRVTFRCGETPTTRALRVPKAPTLALWTDRMLSGGKISEVATSYGLLWAGIVVAVAGNDGYFNSHRLPFAPRQREREWDGGTGVRFPREPAWGRAPGVREGGGVVAARRRSGGGLQRQGLGRRWPLPRLPLREGRPFPGKSVEEGFLKPKSRFCCDSLVRCLWTPMTRGTKTLNSRRFSHWRRPPSPDSVFRRLFWNRSSSFFFRSPARFIAQIWKALDFCSSATNVNPRFLSVGSENSIFSSSVMQIRVFLYDEQFFDPKSSGSHSRCIDDTMGPTQHPGSLQGNGARYARQWIVCRCLQGTSFASLFLLASVFFLLLVVVLI